MASSYGDNYAQKYAQLNTVPALVGIAFVMASAVQFLDASLTLGVVDYTVTNQHAMVISLIGFAVAFAASDTKNYEDYAREEQALVVLGVVVIVGNEMFVEVSDFMVENEPVAGIVAFVVTAAAWGILAR